MLITIITGVTLSRFSHGDQYDTNRVIIVDRRVTRGLQLTGYQHIDQKCRDTGALIIFNDNDFISIALFHVKHAQLR